MSHKRTIMVTSILVVKICLCSFGGNESVGTQYKLKPYPPSTSPVDAFVKAFEDPNVMIGVFEYPRKLLADTVLSSGEKLRDIPGYWEAANRFSLSCLHLRKSIKGKFTEPVVLISCLLAPIFEGMPTLPGFYPFPGSKWVLALERTTPVYRTVRFGKGIEKYAFLNDQTMFDVLWYGYGALCLKWPEDFNEPFYLAKISDLVVEDLDAIQKVTVQPRKGSPDPNDLATIKRTLRGLKTEFGGQY